MPHMAGPSAANLRSPRMLGARDLIVNFVSALRDEERAARENDEGARMTRVEASSTLRLRAFPTFMPFRVQTIWFENLRTFAPSD